MRGEEGVCARHLNKSAREGDAARRDGGMDPPSLEALMQASFIFVVGVAIILSNLLIIATYLNFRGE